MSQGIPNSVSIIIPAYNAGRFIGRALESIRSQTHEHWQLIVIEDGSHDETQSLVEQFATSVSQEVIYRNNGSNQGVSATRNHALSLTQAETIAFLDADDWWEPEHLAAGLQTLEKGADLCYSGFNICVASADKPVTQSLRPTRAQLQTPLDSLFEANFIQSTSLVILKRRVAEAVGDFDVTLKVGEDCDYWMRALIANFQMAYTERVTCNYVKHQSSAMAQTLTVAEHKHLFYQKHLQNDALPLGLRKNGYADSAFQYGRLIRRLEPSLARALFLRAWRIRPLQWQYATYSLLSASQCVLPCSSSDPAL